MVHDPTLSAKIINDDLSRISEWAHRWKMLFNPDITKQAQEVIFSRKNTKNDHPIVYFNEPPVAHTTCQKHLGMHLDEKLNFNHHIKESFTIVSIPLAPFCVFVFLLFFAFLFHLLFSLSLR